MIIQIWQFNFNLKGITMKKSFLMYAGGVVAYIFISRYLKNKETELAKSVQGFVDKASSFLSDLTKNMATSLKQYEANKKEQDSSSDSEKSDQKKEHTYFDNRTSQSGEFGSHVS